MPNSKKEIISRGLKEIEERNNVKIIYACEAGSRAWGFQSKDSDYDVRFIYIRPVKNYLTIQPNTRDVIDNYKNLNFTSFSEEHNLDFSGWDLKKTLWLLYKSNPPLAEWLNSHIVYKDNYVYTTFLKNYVKNNYHIKPLCHHYYHMASTNFREYLKGDIVWLKKYLYVIRPILAVKWLLDNNGTSVPVLIDLLIESVLKDGMLKDEIYDLVRRKIKGEELKHGHKIQIIDDFIYDHLITLRLKIQKIEDDTSKNEENLNLLNEYFLNMCKKEIKLMF